MPLEAGRRCGHDAGRAAKAAAARARRTRSRWLLFLPKSTNKQERQQHASGHRQTNAHQWRWGASGWVVVIVATVATVATVVVSVLGKSEVRGHQRNRNDGHAAEYAKRFHRKSPTPHLINCLAEHIMAR